MTRRVLDDFVLCELSAYFVTVYSGRDRNSCTRKEVEEFGKLNWDSPHTWEIFVQTMLTTCAIPQPTNQRPQTEPSNPIKRTVEAIVSSKLHNDQVVKNEQ